MPADRERADAGLVEAVRRSRDADAAFTAALHAGDERDHLLDALKEAREGAWQALTAYDRALAAGAVTGDGWSPPCPTCGRTDGQPEHVLPSPTAAAASVFPRKPLDAIEREAVETRAGESMCLRTHASAFGYACSRRPHAVGEDCVSAGKVYVYARWSPPAGEAK